MKRAKLMLVAIAVLATVGGALAFKAQKFGAQKYCYSFTETAPNERGECALSATTHIMTNVGSQSIFYAVTADPTECAEATSCPLPASNVILEN